MIASDVDILVAGEVLRKLSVDVPCLVHCLRPNVAFFSALHILMPCRAAPWTTDKVDFCLTLHDQVQVLCAKQFVSYDIRICGASSKISIFFFSHTLLKSLLKNVLLLIPCLVPHCKWTLLFSAINFD